MKVYLVVLLAIIGCVLLASVEAGKRKRARMEESGRAEEELAEDHELNVEELQYFVKFGKMIENKLKAAEKQEEKTKEIEEKLGEEVKKEEEGPEGAKRKELMKKVFALVVKILKLESLKEKEHDLEAEIKELKEVDKENAKKEKITKHEDKKMDEEGKEDKSVEGECVPLFGTCEKKDHCCSESCIDNTCA
ncbi:uncharacterized protein LOC141909895 [Tubulanus polymorphus]|uniref:uncharacterized protein LOC141909895 n=1 Tax=Tubulanus polymorphus TaxID=672921 RepID=UPI003DA2F0E7